MAERPLGEILAEVGGITRLQLAEALQIQKEERGRIGEVLVSLGFMTTRQIRHLIGEYKKRIPLGEYLLEAGVISPEDLDYALVQKNSTREPLGQVLVRSQIINEEQLAKFLSQQLDMPYIEPYTRLVEVGLFNRLPRVFMRHHSILPLYKNGGVVTVVATGMPDEHIMMQLSAVFGDDIDLAISTPTKIQETIKSLLDTRTAPEHEIVTEPDDDDEAIASRIDFSEAALEGTKGKTVAVEWLNYIINEGVREGCSDIHIESMPEHVRVRFRVNGILTHKFDLPIGIRAGLFRRIKALAGMKYADSFRDQEGRLLGQTDKTNIDLRVSTFVGIHGEVINMRLFAQDDGVMEITNLGMPPNVYGMVRRALDQASGLMIVCGPPGSGKTTTMFGALNEINQRHLKVITIEDPVEYHLPGVIQTQLSSHRDSSLAEVIESAVHQDPDVIVIGEISEDEEARILLRAALMGYKMLTTFHANDVLGALLRLGNTHLDTFMRSSTPFTILSQRLVRKVCDDCRVVIAPEPRFLAQFPLRDFDPTKYDFVHGTGCSSCHNTGYRGRTGIFEALTITDEIRQAHMRGASAQEFLKLARASSPFLTLGEVGALKAIRQITTVDEVIRVAPLSPYARGVAGSLSFQEIEHISEMSGVGDWT